ncbi:putative reverse transcriptase [Cucumis melo var. makuwa]|uniref:Reverse transcriptase n=1 Tax=Cucumis melo var. makuwa TaxID=1194695 RepID=A0A5A7UJ42_CUCMM|nr:putative reverse transcriptase [Cucumis melo var. makuwa]
MTQHLMEERVEGTKKEIMGLKEIMVEMKRSRMTEEMRESHSYRRREEPGTSDGFVMKLKGKMEEMDVTTEGNNATVDHKKVKVAVVGFRQHEVDWYRLIHIQQDGTYNVYVKKFVNYLTHMAESVLRDAFVTGLEPIQAEVISRHPHTLEECMKEAQLINDRNLALKLAITELGILEPKEEESTKEEGTSEGNKEEIVELKYLDIIEGTKIELKTVTDFSSKGTMKRMLKGKEVVVLIDSGATHNLIHLKMLCLGHQISNKGVEADEEKIKSMINWPQPKDVTGLRGFPSLTGYYRRFVKGYGENWLRGSLITKWSSNCILQSEAITKSSNKVHIRKRVDGCSSYIAKMETLPFGKKIYYHFRPKGFKILAGTERGATTVSEMGIVDMEVVWKEVEKDEELQKIIDNLRRIPRRIAKGLLLARGVNVIMPPPPPLVILWIPKDPNNEVESMPKEKDLAINALKENLFLARSRMKKTAFVGSKICEKLAPKYYGPYKIIEEIGEVAYRLELPVEAVIHNIFYISQLKLKLGKQQGVQYQHPILTEEFEVQLWPKIVLGIRWSKELRANE